MASPIESLIQKYNLKTSNDFEDALKELIQEIALTGLSRANFFDRAAFYGGTALRIFYGLPRFSEDLDFTLLHAQSDFSLNKYFSSVSELLSSFGFEVNIEAVKKSEDKKVSSAFISANTKAHLLKIVSAKSMAQTIPSNKMMHVKFEVDIFPPLGFETEVKTLLPPITAAIKTLRASSLFAGKMHAVLFRRWKQRIKGRDFYDLLWFIGNNIPLKLDYLAQKMRKGEQWPAEKKISHQDIVELLEEKIKNMNWKNAQQDVLRFLRDPKEVEPWSTDFFLSAIQGLKFEL